MATRIVTLQNLTPRGQAIRLLRNARTFANAGNSSVARYLANVAEDKLATLRESKQRPN